MVKRLAFLAALMASLLIACDASGWLRGGYGWRWPYAAPDSARRRVLPAAAVAIYTLVAWFLDHRHLHWSALPWAFLGALVLPCALLLRWGDDPLYLLYTRTVDPLITGYHTAAVKADVVPSMNDWAAMQLALRGNGLEHVSTQPPGLPLVYEASIALMERLPRLADTLAGYLRPMHCLDAGMASQRSKVEGPDGL